MPRTIKYLKKCGKGDIIKMNGKQYNNVINHTLKSLSESDTLGTARAIFKNMGVALPHGDIKMVYDTVKTDNYMGWKSCSMDEAQSAANEGIAAMGISENRIVVLSADDEEKSQENTAVMTVTDSTPARSVSDLAFYSYRYGGTTDYNVPYFANNSLNVKVGWTGYNALYGSSASTIYWHSSNTDVAVVGNMSGYIQAVGVGSAWITATSNNGYVAEFYIQVDELMQRTETEKTIFGAVVNDVIGAQAYRVSLSITYHITKIRNGKAYIGEISAFTKYDKGNTAVGLDYPDLSIGQLKIGNDTYSMKSDDREMWIGSTWKWDAKVLYLNKWYDLGTAMSLLSILMLDASLFPYRDVKLETEISTT